MKANVVTKIIWFAACSAVLFSVENVRAAEPTQHAAVEKPAAGHAAVYKYTQE